MNLTIRITPSPRILLLTLLLTLIMLHSPQAGQAESGRRALKIKLQGAVLSGTPASVTAEDLEQLPSLEIATFDPYQERRIVYRGVLLNNIARIYGRPDIQRMRIKAIDDYQIEFSREEWQKETFLLATRMDGERMGLQQAGPAKVVMPFNPENETSRHYTPKWIWMVNRIEFLEL